MSTKIQVQWRRNKVLEYLSAGYNQVEIATHLQVDEPTISRDIYFLNKQAQENLERHIHETIPGEYQKGMYTIGRVLKKAWEIVESTADEKTRLQALVLIDHCNNNRMEMGTGNSTIITNALKFVNGKAERLVSRPVDKQSDEIIPDITDIDIDTDNDIETEGVF